LHQGVLKLVCTYCTWHISTFACGVVIMLEILALGDWMAACCGCLLQVTGLRSGRFYASRVVATATAAVDGGQQQVVFAATSSQVLPFRTLATPPGQMQAPALAQRARNALKVRYSAQQQQQRWRWRPRQREKLSWLLLACLTITGCIHAPPVMWYCCA
jgi:hypothetical protein